MNLKVLTLRPDPDSGELDDEALRAFQDGHEVTHVVDHFYFHDGVPTLALLLTWRPRPEAAAYGPAHADRSSGHGRGPRGARGTGPAEAGVAAPGGSTFTADERVLFEALRRWRDERAHRDGVPKHTVLPNRTFEEMIRRRPATKAALMEIPGIGPAKLATYGDELLELLAHAAPPGASPNPDAPPAEESPGATPEPELAPT